MSMDRLLLADRGGACLPSSSAASWSAWTRVPLKIHQRGGAVETGCSDLYDVIH